MPNKQRLSSGNKASFPLFQERQRITQRWVYALIVLPLIPAVVILWLTAEVPESGGGFAGVPGDVWIMLLVIAGSVGFIASIRLDTVIDSAGVRVRLFPFHLRERVFLWEDMASAELRTYSPIGEFGGWGIRYGGKKAGWAYNIKGRDGLQLVLKEGDAGGKMGTMEESATDRNGNVAGKMGAQKEQKEGKRVLIGTSKREEMERAAGYYFRRVDGDR